MTEATKDMEALIEMFKYCSNMVQDNSNISRSDLFHATCAFLIIVIDKLIPTIKPADKIPDVQKNSWMQMQIHIRELQNALSKFVTITTRESLKQVQEKKS